MPRWPAASCRSCASRDAWRPISWDCSSASAWMRAASAEASPCVRAALLLAETPISAPAIGVRPRRGADAAEDASPDSRNRRCRRHRRGPPPALATAIREEGRGCPRRRRSHRPGRHHRCFLLPEQSTDSIDQIIDAPGHGSALPGADARVREVRRDPGRFAFTTFWCGRASGIDRDWRRRVDTARCIDPEYGDGGRDAHFGHDRQDGRDRRCGPRGVWRLMKFGSGIRSSVIAGCVRAVRRIA